LEEEKGEQKDDETKLAQNNKQEDREQINQVEEVEEAKVAEMKQKNDSPVKNIIIISDFGVPPPPQPQLAEGDLKFDILAFYENFLKLKFFFGFQYVKRRDFY